MLIRLLLLITALLFCASGWTANSVTVKGLFKNAALLIIDGEQVMLKKGKTKNGVTLIESSSKDALLKINGKTQRVGLSRQVGANYQAVESRIVRIASQQGGHHWVRGDINGRGVDFFVDTGATHIAMGASTARRLGINYQGGEAAYVNTANGVAEIRLVLLPRVTIGSITKYNVMAGVHLDDRLNIVLLGNSFLSRVNLRTEAGVLIMEDR